jgi:predicted nuclease of predicted toxin-antitoxin system
VKFLLDHDVPAEMARVLTYWGHDVETLRQALPITARDEQVFQHARQHGRLIISCNRAHFLALAEEAIHTDQPFPGLIVLIRRRSRQAECGHLLQLLGRAGEAGLANNVNFA